MAYFYDIQQSLTVRDTVRECLEKDPSDRTDDDIEILLEFTQHLRAFANMTLSVRRALCRVMVFAVVEKAGTVVMNDGEELDSWSVIINGHVEIDGGVSGEPGRTLHLGDRFVFNKLSRWNTIFQQFFQIDWAVSVSRQRWTNYTIGA